MNWNMEKWFYKYRLHLFIWALFIFYETIVIGLVFSIFGHPLTYITHYIAIFFLFYVHADYLLPWSLRDGKVAFWRLPLCILLEIIAYILVSFYIDKFLIAVRIMPDNGHFRLTYLYSLRILYRGVYFLGFATGYYFLVTFTKEKRKTNELEKQHLRDIINSQKIEQELTKAQNAFLKAQINPHFLFNTLDFIYHNIDASSPIAADAVIILTEMMRYAVDADKMGDYIALGDEIEQAENLIYLNQMRKNHTLCLRMNYADEVRSVKLIPLVLLTLVENIFKHGNLNEPADDAVIDIYFDKNLFHIETYNLVSYNSPNVGSHSGLFNIERRLKFAYGEAIEFNYFNDPANHFKLHLSIPLTKLAASAGQ